MISGKLADNSGHITNLNEEMSQKGAYPILRPVIGAADVEARVLSAARFLLLRRSIETPSRLFVRQSMLHNNNSVGMKHARLAHY